MIDLKINATPLSKFPGYGELKPETAGSTVVGRDQLIEATVRALAPGCGGALLVGPSGMGKTAVARQALERLGEDVHIERVRGSAMAARTAYGALGFLLSELNDDALKHPALLLEGMAEVLLDHAQGRRIIISVDNADGLDPLAAMAIGQLVHGGSVTLLVTCQSSAAGDGEFLRLWMEGQLHRFDVEPLALPEVKTLLQNTLGGELSARAVWSLWKRVGGNPKFLQSLANDQVHAGSFLQRDGVWVLAKPVVLSGKGADPARTTLKRMDPQHRRLVEILARVGEMPLDVLSRLGDPVDIDYLQELSTLEVLRSPHAGVRVRDRFFADVVRHHLTPARSRELWNEVAQAIELTRGLLETIPALAAWGLECGYEVDTKTALQAAGTANRLGDFRSALMLLGNIPERRSHPAALLEEIKALAATGKLREARAACEAVPGTPDPQSLGEWVLLMIERSRVARSLEGNAAESALYLTEAREALGATEGLSTRQRRKLGDQMTLAEAEQASFEGRYTDISDHVLELYTDRRRTLTTRLRAGSELCEAWAMTGRQQEATELGQRLLSECAGIDVGEVLHGTVCRRVFSAVIITGMLSTCLDILDGSEAMAIASQWQVLDDELARGIVHAYAGRSDQAVEFLRPALMQLEIDDPRNSLPLAQAALAYAYTLRNEAAKARRLVELALEQDRPLSWHRRRTVDYFTVMATSNWLPRDEVAADLARRADQDLDNGNVAQTLIFLNAAARLTGISAAEQLAETANKSDGLYAELCEDFGTGLSHQSAPLLVRAAQLAEQAGNTLLCYEAARAGYAVSAAERDRATMRSARSLENASFRRLRHRNSIAARLASLGAFELQLARHASTGDSSVAIGKNLNLSHRTVDWHLGKLFEKLHVSGRSELREILD